MGDFLLLFSCVFYPSSFFFFFFYKIVVNMGTVYKRDKVILLLEAEMRVLNKVSNSSYNSAYNSSMGSFFFLLPCSHIMETF